MTKFNVNISWRQRGADDIAKVEKDMKTNIPPTTYTPCQTVHSMPHNTTLYSGYHFKYHHAIREKEPFIC